MIFVHFLLFSLINQSIGFTLKKSTDETQGLSAVLADHNKIEVRLVRQISNVPETVNDEPKTEESKEDIEPEDSATTIADIDDTTISNSTALDDSEEEDEDDHGIDLYVTAPIITAGVISVISLCLFVLYVFKYKSASGPSPALNN